MLQIYPGIYDATGQLNKDIFKCILFICNIQSVGKENMYTYGNFVDLEYLVR